jgi:uncharacterized protein YndB with AHSA1/START domain
MDATAETTSVERQVSIEASPETIWEFLVDPDKATRWMGLSATLEPEPGGLYRVEVIPGHTARGEFVELDPPRRIVYTWGWEEGESSVPPGTSTVEIELIPEGDGTTVRLLHSDLPSAAAAESHGHGWQHYLERLAIAAPGGDAGEDPWISGPMD